MAVTMQDAFQRSSDAAGRTIKMTYGNERNMLESNLYFRIVYFNTYVYLSGYVIQQEGDSRDRL